MIITNIADNFITASKTSPVRNAEEAAQRASDFLELPRDLNTLSYEVTSDDFHWLPNPSAQEESAITQAKQKYGSLVHPPKAETTASGWDVTLWRIDSRVLVKHVVSVTAAGELSDSAEAVSEELPVVVGI